MQYPVRFQRSIVSLWVASKKRVPNSLNINSYFPQWLDIVCLSHLPFLKSLPATLTTSVLRVFFSVWKAAFLRHTLFLLLVNITNNGAIRQSNSQAKGKWSSQWYGKIFWSHHLCRYCICLPVLIWQIILWSLHCRFKKRRWSGVRALTISRTIPTTHGDIIWLFSAHASCYSEAEPAFRARFKIKPWPHICQQHVVTDITSSCAHAAIDAAVLPKVDVARWFVDLSWSWFLWNSQIEKKIPMPATRLALQFYLNPLLICLKHFKFSACRFYDVGKNH